MLNFFKKTLVKSKAATIIQNLLELRSQEGCFTGDPQKTATYIIEKAWETYSRTFYKVIPQDITLAAAGLINETRGKSHVDPHVNEMLYALILIIKEVENNKIKYESKFQACDFLIMEEAVELINSM